MSCFVGSPFIFGGGWAPNILYTISSKSLLLNIFITIIHYRSILNFEDLLIEKIDILINFESTLLPPTSLTLSSTDIHHQTFVCACHLRVISREGTWIYIIHPGFRRRMDRALVQRIIFPPTNIRGDPNTYEPYLLRVIHCRWSGEGTR